MLILILAFYYLVKISFLGASIDHLTRPKETFFYNISGSNSSNKIPIRSSFHGGYKIKVLTKWFIS